MIGESGTSHTGDIHHYYKCSNRKKHHSCKKDIVKKQELEDLVISSTLKHILNADIIEDLTTQILKVQEENHNIAEIEVLKQQLAETNSYIKNILTAIKKGIITDSTQKELEQLEADKTEIEKKIALAEHDANTYLTRERIQFWFKQFAEFDTNDAGAREYLITYFIHCILLYDDKMIIIFNHEGDNRTELGIDEIEAAFGSDFVPLVEMLGVEPKSYAAAEKLSSYTVYRLS